MQEGAVRSLVFLVNVVAEGGKTSINRRRAPLFCVSALRRSGGEEKGDDRGEGAKDVCNALCLAADGGL